MYMARHDGRAGRAATLLGRLKYCPTFLRIVRALDFSRALVDAWIFLICDIRPSRWTDMIARVAQEEREI